MKKGSPKGGVKNLNTPASATKKATPANRNLNKQAKVSPSKMKMGGANRKSC